jgi:hypothetical protein
MLPYYAGTAPVGDPVSAYAAAIAAAVPRGGVVTLVHATAYSDDQQMMVYLARRLETAGVSTHLASPLHVRWRGQEAWLDAAWWRGRLDAVSGSFRPTGWPAWRGRRRGRISTLADARR